jgi:hypothetical protein
MRTSPTIRAVFLVASLMIATRVLAADIDALKGTTAKERAEAQTLMMKEELGLDDATVQKVRAINLKYAEKMDPTLQGPDGPLLKSREAYNLQQQKEGELKAVLSPGQYEKYLASKLEMRDHIVERVFEERGKTQR